MNPNIKIHVADSRSMHEIPDESIDLIVTSPPYWDIKDYGTTTQIGYGQTLHNYLIDMFRVWSECYRLLKPGRKLCINIGDQFTRTALYGFHKIIPIHAEFTVQCEHLGFDHMSAIIWQKRSSKQTTGGASIMGSYPYPPNGLIEMDYEYILLFKKPGQTDKPAENIVKESTIAKHDWMKFFQSHWTFGGSKQTDHKAVFPEELPLRLIKMYSYVGDTILDPFMGSGTTAQAAVRLSRNAIGYEINETFIELIKQKCGGETNQLQLMSMSTDLTFYHREEMTPINTVDYKPLIKNCNPVVNQS